MKLSTPIKIVCSSSLNPSPDRMVAKTIFTEQDIREITELGDVLRSIYDGLSPEDQACYHKQTQPKLIVA